MEVAALAACLNTLLPRLWDHRKEKKKERIAIKIDIEDIRTTIRRLDAAFEDAKFKGHGTGSAAATELKRRARESSQQIHDSIQRFFIIKDTDCTAFAMTTKAHKENLQSICQELEKLSSEETASEKPEDPFVADPMDMGEPKTELLELVKLPGSRPWEETTDAEGDLHRRKQRMRKVISIVGFGGLGKTLLAKLIYDHDHPFPAQASSSTSTPPADRTLRAWVTAAAKMPQEVLREILKQLDAASKHGNLNSVKAQADTTCKYENLKLDELGKRLAERLRKQRYFIVIDDMQSKETWNFMNDAFPMDGNGDGTIIVTTTIKSVADACSSRNGYVYKLSPLDEKKSLELFLKDRKWDPALTKGNASDILNKCEGLPLAIVSMSQSLEGRGVLTSHVCEDACKGLGANLVNEKGGLTRLRWVLMNNYTSLAGYNLRACLLYFCMYKHNMGAVPKRNSLIRRWEAERFLVERNRIRRPTDVGAENLETLVDRNIIQPMEVGINGTARRCRPPGMMLEYISQISMLENFAALVCDAVETGESHIRRLSFRADSGVNESKISMMDLSIVLTLAVSGDGCKAILTFKKYELIAVLDLKECTNLQKSHVEDICDLLLLKYLSLGDRIGEIPHRIRQLKLLETLEMRTKETVKVYREVLELPNLKHLLGNFMLREHADTKLCTFLEEDGGLESVTGFVTKTTKGFPKLMNHMVRVTKLKIYCDAGNKNDDDIGEAIKKFIGRAMDTFRSKNEGTDKMAGGTSCSLSINLSNSIGEQWAPPLEFLQCSGSLNSLKLRGGWGTFQLPTIPATGEDSNSQQPKITVPATGEYSNSQQPKITVPATVEQSKRKAVPEPLTTIIGFKKLCLSHTSKRGKNILDKPTVPASGEQSKPRLLGPFTTITGITKLCLSHTSMRGKNILATLTHMSTLEYLKLEEENLGPLTIESCTFQSLVRLFLMGETIPQEGETSPQGITIQLEALPSLVSLHVISKAPIFRVVEDQSYKGKGKQVQLPISQSEDHQVQLPKGCLGCLQEIALHSGVQPDMHKAWKRAAKDHPNRPAVMQITPNA